MTHSRGVIWIALADAMDRLVALKRSGDTAMFNAQKRVVDGLADRCRKAAVPAKLIEACVASQHRFGCCGMCQDPDECEATKKSRLICRCGEPKYPVQDYCTAECEDKYDSACPVHGTPYRVQYGSEGDDISHICDDCINED